MAKEAKKFEEKLEVAVEAADDKKAKVSPLEAAMELIGVLHNRVKRLEDAKGWHDEAECQVFCSK